MADRSIRLLVILRTLAAAALTSHVEINERVTLDAPLTLDGAAVPTLPNVLALPAAYEECRRATRAAWQVALRPSATLAMGRCRCSWPASSASLTKAVEAAWAHLFRAYCLAHQLKQSDSTAMLNDVATALRERQAGAGSPSPLVVEAATLLVRALVDASATGLDRGRRRPARGAAGTRYAAVVRQRRRATSRGPHPPLHCRSARAMDSPAPIFELVSSVLRAAPLDVTWPESFWEALRALFRWLPAGVDAGASTDLAATVATAALARLGTPAGQAAVELIASAMEQPEFAADSATLEAWTDALAVRCMGWTP